MIEVAKTIAEMQSSVTPVDDKLVYVKGYFNPGDGGEGFFVFKSASTQQDNLGTVFRSDFTSEGKWIRQYSGYMNVGYFGVQKGWANPVSGFSNSDRIQNMIDYASSYSSSSTEGLSQYNEEKDVTIFFPNGIYYIDKSLILKDEIRILGSTASHLTNKGDVYDYMFEIDNGVVTKLRMENLFINCNQSESILAESVGGIRIKGTPPKPGGLWDAIFRNIIIRDPNNPAIYLEGGDESTAYEYPNQFIVFDNVRAQRIFPKHPALKMTGQNANYTFLNCEFRNTDDHVIDGTCIYISSVVSGSNAISFINSGFGGYSRYGAVIEHATNITFDTCFCEGMDIALSIKNSEDIQILNTRFANAAGAGSLGSSFSHTNNVGRIIEAESSIVNVYNNYMAVSSGTYYPDVEKQFFIQGIVPNDEQYSDNVFNVANNAFFIPELSKTSGIMQVESIEFNELNLSSKKLVFVNVPPLYSNANDLKRINSEISAGETLFIRANGGPIKILPKGTQGVTNGNIFLNGRTDLTITNGQGALFIKIDGDNGGGDYSIYQLLSIAD
ncbi:hypothetical protein [uncultured Flavobacterium sp.]|uniref:hypothetical protein n=1 Tax=uncultured Flavobacterium sp. TaxID=165435 RepID=UPI0025F9F91E|nr:hypothetical protein [uncultured Flavobacterium sp.]